MLRHLNEASHPDLLVGTATGDDALVWRRPQGPALVASVDFFTPIVDDARTWGRIAAANSASDIYAMGGRPLFALNLAAWPRSELSLDLLGEVLAGGSEIAAEGGWVVAGGHTVDGPEPMYGQSVVGEVDVEALLSNAGGRPRLALVLTKAIGTGIVSTMVKGSAPADFGSGGRFEKAYEAAVDSMVTLNLRAAEVARTASAVTATDITGFGLLGHLHKLALSSGVAAVVEASAVPVLPGAMELLEAGFVPGGTVRNLEFVRPFLRSASASGDGAVGEDTLTILADAQTSGGLLFACPPEAAPNAVAELLAGGNAAAVVGELIEGEPGSLLVRA